MREDEEDEETSAKQELQSRGALFLRVKLRASSRVVGPAGRWWEARSEAKSARCEDLRCSGGACKTSGCDSATSRSVVVVGKLGCQLKVIEADVSLQVEEETLNEGRSTSASQPARTTHLQPNVCLAATCLQPSVTHQPSL